MNAISNSQDIGAVLFEYTAGANETWSTLLNHCYGYTKIYTALYFPDYGAIYYPSASNKFSSIVILDNGKLAMSSMYVKQSGSVYKSSYADSTSVSDDSSSSVPQGVKVRIVKVF